MPTKKFDVKAEAQGCGEGLTLAWASVRLVAVGPIQRSAHRFMHDVAVSRCTAHIKQASMPKSRSKSKDSGLLRGQEVLLNGTPALTSEDVDFLRSMRSSLSVKRPRSKS